MADVIVFASPTKVKIVHPAPGVSVEQALAAIYRDGQLALPTTPYVVVDETMIPTDRTRRHAWRVQGGQVVDDLTVPDPPDPKQAWRDEIAAATTLAALKAAILKVVR
jgi:anti-sigma factor ChrR (cupin superfamily)